MASRLFDEGTKQIAAKVWTTDTFKALLLMTNTTVDTDADTSVDDITDFTTLDEHDGAAYARVTLAGKAITKDDANGWSILDCDNITFATLGAGTRQAAGVLIVWDDGGTLRPIGWHELAAPVDADGSDLTLRVPATGLYKITRP